MIITLNYKSPLGLPSGVTLQPGVPTPVHGWESDRKSKIVQAWVKSGILKVGHEPSQFMPDDGQQPSSADDAPKGQFLGLPDAGGETSGSEEASDESTQDDDAADESTAGETGEQTLEEAPQHSEAEEKAQLLAALEAKGIKVDKRTGIKRLRELSAES